MEGGWDLLVAAIVGVILGAAATFAFQTSNREPTPEEYGPDVSPDEAAMLAAYGESGIVLAESDEVLRANAQAIQFGLVRARRLLHEPLIEMVRVLRETGQAQSADLTLRRGPDEGARPIYLHVTAAPLTRGRVLILGHDQSAARRLDETRRDFVANVSHELKTPVGAISLLAETVAENPDRPEVVARFSQQMRQEAERLSSLVQEIIDLSRLQEPDALASSTVVDVDEVVRQAKERVQVSADNSDIKIVVGPRTGLEVLGDPALLVTAVRNLLANAVNYSPPHTTVSVGVSAKGRMVRIAVVDQGIGIEPAAQARVFERFYRVDHARSRSTGGTGLGLAIAKHVAADHGGEVTLWSQPGRGSTFTVVIPQYLEEPRSALEEGS